MSHVDDEPSGAQPDAMPVTVARILEISGDAPVAGVTRQAVRGLVACLDAPALAEGLIDVLEIDPPLAALLQKRLAHLHETGAVRSFPDALGRELLQYESDRPPVRRRVETMLVALYRGFRPSVRRRILRHFWDDGARTAFTTVVRHERTVFPHEDLLAAARLGDVDAARELAWYGHPKRLGELLPHLLDAPPWIVRGAGARSKRIAASTWRALREKLPGSYTYLCLRRRRALTDEKAWRLVEAAFAHVDPEESDIALWALGELGREALLERAAAEAERLAALRPAGAKARRPFRRRAR